ncbi:LPXTG cell wall anchor domain-containing protein [Streptomyces sp. NBC_01262]|uniref:LPXTG cell wall anchor domain-containing protein n=1 Tax=Streptomyces sp. NBC_01262 TaxID=2903803 RepID=UPI002E3064F5|nr:LPXTG cell wall anchor domain-containing protein [Streptomyces sp. NBC_01262]
MRTLFPACAVAAAVSLLLAPAAAPAFAADGDTYTVPIHQTLPLTATSEGVENEATCSTIPDDQDGWHFVLPGNSTDFVKLTVTFKPGGEQVVTSFGPPSDKHAYVASEPGAELVSAVAEVKGGEVNWFNLSHTCPAGSGSSESSSPSPSASTSASASESASGSASPSVSASASDSASASSSASASATATATASTGSDLASTGANVGGIAIAAVLLLAAGGALVVLRRRKA